MSLESSQARASKNGPQIPRPLLPFTLRIVLTLCLSSWVSRSRPPTAQAELTEKYAELMPDLAGMARSLVRDLDPQNDLEFLRIRAKESEIMISPHEDFTLIAIQNLNTATPE